jgi:phosphatidate cytidylyltransferase
MSDTTGSATAPPAAPSKLRIFLRRLLSTAVLWTAVLLALFWSNRVLSNYLFLAVMIFLAVTGLLEFYGMARKKELVCFAGWGIFGGVLLMVGTFLNLTHQIGTFDSPARVNDFETGFLILFVLGLCLRQFFSKTNTAGVLAISVTLFGLMYIPWLLNFIQKINFFPGVQGHYFLLYFLLVTKSSDTGAYCVGSLFGRHKMIPRISPGKTWEGFVGALLGSILASVLFVHFLGGHMVGMTPTNTIVLGLVLGLCAVVGDLIESLFKRQAGVKDSGNYFPGIGGILDLLDSLLFNAPIMYLFLRHILTAP